MLTGDKGKTAKMIGVQCGMLTPLERSLGSQKATRPDIDFQVDGDEDDQGKNLEHKIKMM